MRHVKITTPSRLHFSLLDLNGVLGRVDGGFGLAIAKPNFQIVAERATGIHLPPSVYRDRTAAVLKRLRETHPFPGIQLRFESEIPMHCGFGSGTQLSLGVAHAVNLLYALGLDVRALAKVVGRGGTSGIGIAAFQTGGFIVDGGHRFPEQKASFLPSSALGDISPPPGSPPLPVSRSAPVNCDAQLFKDLWGQRDRAVSDALSTTRMGRTETFTYPIDASTPCFG